MFDDDTYYDVERMAEGDSPFTLAHSLAFWAHQRAMQERLSEAQYMRLRAYEDALAEALAGAEALLAEFEPH